MEALAVIGLALIVIGGIWMIVVAFKTSIGWGIGCLVIPPVSLVFLFKYWDESSGRPGRVEQLAGGRRRAPESLHGRVQTGARITVGMGARPSRNSTRGR